MNLKVWCRNCWCIRPRCYLLQLGEMDRIIQTDTFSFWFSTSANDTGCKIVRTQAFLSLISGFTASLKLWRAFVLLSDWFSAQNSWVKQFWPMPIYFFFTCIYRLCNTIALQSIQILGMKLTFPPLTNSSSCFTKYFSFFNEFIWLFNLHAYYKYFIIFYVLTKILFQMQIWSILVIMPLSLFLPLSHLYICLVFSLLQ